MSNNRDDQKNDPPRQGDPKRPHATLDLKAVELKTPEQKPQETKTASSGAAGNAPGSGAKSDAKPDTKPEAKAGATATAASSSTSSAASGKDETGKPNATADTAAKDKPPTPPQNMPPPERKGGGGFGRFVSHMLAGIIGGFLALISAEDLVPQLNQLGLPVGQAKNVATEQLGKRISALEAA